MKISLSSNDILLQVYALAALDATLRDSYSTMLSPSRRSALQALLSGVAAELCIALSAAVVDTNIDTLTFDPEADTLIEFDLRPATVAQPAALRLLMERAIIARLLGEIHNFNASEAAATHLATYDQLLHRITAAISRPLSTLRLKEYRV